MDQLRVTQVNDVFYVDRFDGKAHVRGTLHLTLTHIFFLGSSRNQEIWLNNHLIADVEKLPLSTGGAPLVIYGKNFRIIHLLLPRERDCHEVYTTIKELKAVASLVDLACFRMMPMSCQWDRTDGWDNLDLKSQFKRFGLPNASWSLTDLNSDYQICDTYPKLLCVPAVVSQSILKASAKFRSRGRIPVLTYLHPNGTSALCRSSQPLAGFSSKCVEDQFLLEAIRSANPSSSTLYVVDTRPPLNALTNRAQGKGYEDVTVYRNVAIQFFDIENIHVVRSSLKKLLKTAQDPAITMEAFVSGQEQSGWLRHLRCILEAAFFVATRLNEGSSVLVHCSDGWDRTTQVCSLAQIILDPYYRTLSGLEALIKKEWLQFGHKFSERCGHVSSSDAREISPIFTQFLDCVRHLCDWCPTEFEYNCDLLCCLHDEVYATEYGTFVGCSEREREELRLRETAYSLWPMLSRLKERFTNPYYKFAPSPVASDTLGSIVCDGTTVPNGRDLTSPVGDSSQSKPKVDMLPASILAPQLFRIWRGLFLRWEWRLPNPDRRIAHVVSDLTNGLATLTSHSRILEARISQLCALLHKPIDSVLPSAPVTEVIASTPKNLLNSKKFFPVYQDAPEDVFQCTGVPVSPAITLTSDETRNNPHVSLAPLSVRQLQAELQSVSVNWIDLARQDVPCSNCGGCLALADQVVHCHQCGSPVCMRCVNLKPRTLAGLSYPQLHRVWMCEQCAVAFDKHLASTRSNS